MSTAHEAKRLLATAAEWARKTDGYHETEPVLRAAVRAVDAGLLDPQELKLRRLGARA